MKLRSGWVFLALSALTGALAAGATAGGCQSSGQSTGSTGSGGTGGETSMGNTMSTASMSGSGGASASTGTGANQGCTSMMDASIDDITTGKVGVMTPVSLKGVVAMSQKWLVSHSKSSGSCLWGVY